MLNPEIIKIAQERIKLETSEQIVNLNLEISAAKSKAAARGYLRSGAFLNEILNLCTLTIKNRAQLVWQILHRFLTTGGISYSEPLANELKAIVSAQLPKGLFHELLKKNAEMTGKNTTIMVHLAPQLDVARIVALENIGTEIDLFCLSLKKMKESEETGKSETTFNIYAPVGAIQMGGRSVANVTQHIDAEVKDQILNALKEISATINQSDFTMQCPKEDVNDIINESQIELKKQTPNITKLGSMLSTIGTIIRTIAALQPAYNTLKYALTYFGIHLP